VFLPSHQSITVLAVSQCALWLRQPRGTRLSKCVDIVNKPLTVSHNTRSRCIAFDSTMCSPRRYIVQCHSCFLFPHDVSLFANKPIKTFGTSTRRNYFAPASWFETRLYCHDPCAPPVRDRHTHKFHLTATTFRQDPSRLTPRLNCRYNSFSSPWRVHRSPRSLSTHHIG
jgi:hypothetical protein